MSAEKEEFTPKQKIEKIKLDDLILWTENPRERVGDNEATTEDIITMALKDRRKRWNLKKLYGDMGRYYDLSELPTVVRMEGKFIVYDGNRRIALIKYLQNPDKFENIRLPSFVNLEEKEYIRNLKEIECNVCDENTALENVSRKHRDDSTWKQLERDYFEHIQRDKDASFFLLFEEATELITKYDELNKRFVKDEVLTRENLEAIGFKIEGKNLKSVYNDEDATLILGTVVEGIINKQITTRINRPQKGKLDEILPILDIKLADKIERVEGNESELQPFLVTLEVTPREFPKLPEMFPYDLELKPGTVNDLYNDLRDFSKYYNKSESNLSKSFPHLFNMSLRFLAEAATPTQDSSDIEEYVKKHFDDALKTLSPKDKNLMHEIGIDTHGVLLRRLQAGAHKKNQYPSYERACNLSIIVGAMISISHGKD